MKKIFSRLLAGILAVSLVCSSGNGIVFAEASAVSGVEENETGSVLEGAKEETPDETDREQDTEMNPEEGETQDKEEGLSGQEETEQETPVPEEEREEKTPEEQPVLFSLLSEKLPADQPVQGTVEIRIAAGIEFLSEESFAVSLRGADGTEKRAELKLAKADEENADASEDRAVFSDLDAGTYVLRVSAPGYVTYEQSMEVKNLGYRIQLYAGRLPLLEKEGKAQPGLLLYGDVNGDGAVDERDAYAVIDAAEAGQVSGLCDLNGDGAADILDLDYLTSFMEKGSGQEARPETYISPDAAEGSTGQHTEIKGGSTEGVLTGEKLTVGVEGADAITEEKPAELSFDFSKTAAGTQMEEIVVESPSESENAIAEGTVTVEYLEDGVSKTMKIAIPSRESVMRSAAQASWGADGSLHINLGGQIAVKKVTFKITATSGKTNLAEISKVEFVNDMESRIPEPEMNIPGDLKAVGSNKKISLSWTAQTNVTAYEVAVTLEGKTEYRRTTSASMDLVQFDGKELVNNKVYTVKVQSLNGEWKSGFSEEIQAVPKPDGVPDAPDNVAAEGGYRSFKVKWKKNNDADSYNLFYKEKGADSFQKIEGIKATEWTVEGLKDQTAYIVYLTGVNDLGEGPACTSVEVSTLSGLTLVKLPAYRLINTSNGDGKLSEHIIEATASAPGVMMNSPLDQEKNSATGLFDNRAESYVESLDWDYGAAYNKGTRSITARLDKEYEIGMITFAEPVDLGRYTHVNVQYQDENGTWKDVEGETIQLKTSGDRKYHMIKFAGPVTTSGIRFGVGRENPSLRKVTISEVRFYTYDSLEQDILGLYADNLYLTLKESVTGETLAALQERLDTPDPVSGEYHPEREALQKELTAAKQLFETGNLGGVTEINTEISLKKDSGIALGGLNAWQPLGITAEAGEQLVVYVGAPGKKAGASTELQLVFTQHHAESTELSKTQSLKIGRNEITVPNITGKTTEQGGALYIQYTGNKSTDSYAVRVSGGSKIPMLNVYGVQGEERLARIEAYVNELNTYTAELKNLHDEKHTKDYDERNCILDETDILMNHMMFSIPASQVQKGLGASGQAQKLAGTIEAMEEMMTLFYQHKGLHSSFAEGTAAAVVEKNHIPCSNLNIRYMRMFSGAFMYAGGNHIGIEWDQTSGLMGGVPVVSDENGKYQSGQYFGWGIAHEIGHQINQSAYTFAEVTNNYFAVLAQAKDNNASVRFQYDDVFEKVTSGTKGYSDSVATQLGLYWQLHLAYDRDYNYKTYNTWQETKDSLFYARVDSYARDTASAPAPKGTALTLTADRDQNLMRLAAAAAQKDLTEFFERWGMTPDKDTLQYMNQFEKETRAIFYQDDEARVYEMENGIQDSVEGQKAASVSASANGSEVQLTIGYTGKEEVLHGFEIVRVYTEQGRERRETAGFTRTKTFTDSVSFASNRTLSYEVTAVDKYMNRSEAGSSDALKIEGDGRLDETFWTIETNLVSEDDTTAGGTENEPCAPEKVSASYKVMDNDAATTFRAKTETEEPYLTVKLNESTPVSALRYTLKGSGQAIGSFTIEVSEDGSVYTKVKEGSFELKDGSQTVYFEDGEKPWVATYDAAYVRLTAVGQQGQELSITELDLFGPSGDNVDFLTGDGKAAIGTLKEDYQYGQKAEEKIPKDSLIFMGTYKGNPAYNVVMLYDENGNIVGGTDSEGALRAQQIILAPNPGNALLGEVSDGTWIYWIEPQDLEGASLPAKVRAELYRVDNAITNEGQRLVSDTLFTEMPEELPEISFTAK